MLTNVLLALGSVSAATAACAPRSENGTNVGVSTGSTPAIACPIVLDGRVPSTVELTDLDVENGIFNPDYVKAKDVKWSESLRFPDGASRFDTAGGDFKPVEVTINNASIFMTQFGFRRAGLQFVEDTNLASPGYVGVKTLHFSIKGDADHALNTSHEYLNAWHEASDYSANQFNFQTGLMIDQPDLPADDWKLFDRDMSLLWSVERESDTWQNFALVLDIDANTIQVYYSTGTDALVAKTEALPADLSGEGQYQIGVLKKPTGSTDVVNTGYQSAPFEEGLIYGGIFVEDSAGGCISL